MGLRWPLWLLLLLVTGTAALAFSGTGVAQAVRTPGIELLAPLQGWVSWAANGVAGLVAAVQDREALAEENRQLKQQVDRLERELARLREAGEENRQLRALLDYERDNPGREYLSASVIAVDGNNLTQSIVINQGSGQSLQKGMVVVADVGLVGKVVEVYPRAAKVLLVTDPSSVVNAVVQRSRVQGVVTGRADRTLNLNYVPRDADVLPGDLVVTSGLGGGFPKGIPLGAVTHVAGNDQASFKEVRLAPATRLRSLQSVLVVRDFVPIELR